MERCEYAEGYLCKPDKGIKGCFLYRQARSQSKMGAYKDSKRTLSGGPFWVLRSWREYIASMLNVASQKGNECFYISELPAELDKITTEKVDKGDFT